MIFLEHRADFEEEVGLEEGFVSAIVRPRAEEACFVAVAEPVSDKGRGG